MGEANCIAVYKAKNIHEIKNSFRLACAQGRAKLCFSVKTNFF